MLYPCSKIATSISLFVTRIASTLKSFSLTVDDLLLCVLMASIGIGIAPRGR